jgi:zinc-binding alcohol dehydrogenase/oxidoreductase
MKALVVESKNSPFVIRDVPQPAFGDDDILVKLKASAFNHRDYYIQQGTYPRTKFPLIIGSDGAGIVENVGKNVHRSLIGSEVVINPSHNWGDDPSAQQKEYTVLGFPENGTFAEYIATPARYIHPKPQHLSWEAAAALPLAGLTAYRALHTKANLSAGETVLITGIGGGVALCALQFAVAVGARVYVTSGSAEKIQRAIALGASGGVNYRKDSWAHDLQLLSGGFDVIVDGAVGLGFGKLLDIASPGGRIVVYGSTQGRIMNAEPARIFWKQLSILGTTMGTEQEFGAMLKFVEEKKIVPVIDSVVPFEDASKALKRMESGTQFGKLVVRNS